MSSRYSIWLLSPTGEKLILLDRIVSIDYVMSVNAIGLAKIKLKSDFDLAQFVQEDSRIEIWRHVQGQANQIDGNTVWFIRDWKETRNKKGNEIQITAYSANHILARAIIAYASGRKQATKNIALDDMMKEIVRENLGALAEDTNRNFTTYILVASNLSDAPVSLASFAWKNLFSTLQDIAQNADELGTKLFFGMVYNPNDGILTFTTRTGQWGIEHSLSDNSRVVLSVRSGSLSEIRQEYLSSAEKNLMYVGGKGKGKARDIITTIDNNRLLVAPLNRAEQFIQSTGTANNDLAELANVGRIGLKKFRPVSLFSAKVRDTAALKYGREYGFGDRVLIEQSGIIRPTRIDSVAVKVSKGKENINVILRGD